MTAAVDGDPPLPPEHIQPSAFGCGTICAGNESKHPDASFIFDPKHPGTQTYVRSTIAKFNGCQQLDHEPPQTTRTLPSPSATSSNNRCIACNLSSDIDLDDFDDKPTSLLKCYHAKP